MSILYLYSQVLFLFKIWIGLKQIRIHDILKIMIQIWILYFGQTKLFKIWNLNIIGTQFFKKLFINKNEKYWRTFNSKIFKKDIVFYPDQLPNWVNSVKFEFTQLKSDQINQLKSNTLQKLLDLLCFSNIIDDFESNLNLNNEVE